jgi:MYXO-CTERM domain-containing protein
VRRQETLPHRLISASRINCARGRILVTLFAGPRANDGHSTFQCTERNAQTIRSEGSAAVQRNRTATAALLTVLLASALAPSVWAASLQQVSGWGSGCGCFIGADGSDQVQPALAVALGLALIALAIRRRRAKTSGSASPDRRR